MPLSNAKAHFLTMAFIGLTTMLIIGVVVVFGWHLVSYAISWKVLVGMLILLAVALLAIEGFRVGIFVIKLPMGRNQQVITSMSTQAEQEKKEAQEKSSTVDILSVPEARAWLDDFLVEQQSSEKQ